MAEQLTTEQILLLNNLMYANNEEPLEKISNSDAKTVAEFVNNIDTSKLDGSTNYGSYLTGDDWNKIITAVKNDPQLMNLEIAATHVADEDNGGGGGTSALFVDPSTNEAIVTFRGTASHEWKDNFVGGGPTSAEDGVSTSYQENAYEWYQTLELGQYDTITVTGHSKGGNKAKYITVMDDSVDRCVSFDGQGFSDEFFQKYDDRIAEVENKITNHNVEGDYVNILLNDIGERNYYEAFDLGDGKFLENHAPNTYLDFNDDGTFQMVPGTQDKNLAEIDQFLNSYLRSLSPEDKADSLALLGELVEGGFNGADANNFLDILLDDDNADHAAYLVAYLLKYKEENPELVDALKSVLSDMGMDDLDNIVDAVVDITEWKYFDEVLDFLGSGSKYIPDFLLEWLQDYLKDKGIDLSVKDIRKLLAMLETASEEMNKIDSFDSGYDRMTTQKQKEVFDKVVSKFFPSSSGKSDFSINIVALRHIVDQLQQHSIELKRAVETIDTISGNLPPKMDYVKAILKKIREDVEKEAKTCEEMSKVLNKILKCYETTEKKIVAC